MTTSQCLIIQKQLQNITSYLEPLLPLVNSHMVDYFSKSAYDSFLPKEIRAEISENGYEIILDSILSNKHDRKSPKLNEYIIKTRNLCLYNLKDVCISKSDLNTKLLEWGCKDIPSLKLEVFVTPKKSHEVEVLSKVAAALSYINKTSHIIDIGDGKGYLSSMLALHHKIPVLGIDASQVNTDGAVKRARMLEKAWKGIGENSKKSMPKQNKDSPITNNLYKQVTQFVTEDTNFEQLINDVFLENSSRLGVVGLHTCGNLGSTSARIFNNNKNVKMLCNVSCCYHLLSEEFDDGDPYCDSNSSFGFPMSSFLKKANFKLGRTARMLSSQSVDRILHKKEGPSTVIFYRAVLEVLLQKYNSYFSKKQVGKCRKKFQNFTEYAQNALKSINSDVNISDHELSELFNKYKEYDIQLNVFFLLRCMLAPVIESLILLDRLLFLHENRCESAFLVQLFDPVISPRCYGLVAFKRDNLDV